MKPTIAESNAADEVLEIIHGYFNALSLKNLEIIPDIIKEIGDVIDRDLGIKILGAAALVIKNEDNLWESLNDLRDLMEDLKAGY